MTQRKRWIAVLTALLLMLSVLSVGFTAAAENDEPMDPSTTCTIEVVIRSGSGTISDGTQTSQSTLILTPTIGSTVTLTATPGDGNEILYWINAATEKVLSFNTTLTFIAGSSRDIRLYFDSEESGKHRVVYFSQFDNIVYSASVDVGSTAYFARIPNTTLYSGGRVWTGWDMSPAQVAAESGRVFVHPTFATTAEHDSYTVTSIVNGTTTTDSYVFGETCRLEAPATYNGKSFSYWIAPADPDDPNSVDTVASPNRIYKFVVVMDVTLQAVYGDPDAKTFAIRMVGDVPDYDGNLITLYAEHNATSAWTSVEDGMLVTRTPVGSADEFELYSGDPEMIQGTNQLNSRIGTYVYTMENWVEDAMPGQTYHFPLIYARAYMILRNNSTGQIRLVYSDIYCANHTDKEYYFIDTNYDDPLANP